MKNPFKYSNKYISENRTNKPPEEEEEEEEAEKDDTIKIIKILQR